MESWDTFFKIFTDFFSLPLRICSKKKHWRSNKKYNERQLLQLFLRFSFIQYDYPKIHGLDIRKEMKYCEKLNIYISSIEYMNFLTILIISKLSYNKNTND